MYEFILQKHCDYWLEKQSIMLRSVPQMLKKWRIIVNRISKVRQTTCNLMKKILDEATWMVNVFLISWFFYLFLLCSIILLVKYDFILWYEAWVNVIRVSNFIENAPQISIKPIAFQWNLRGTLPRKLAVLYQSYLSETGLENSHKIPAESAIFPWICPWKSCEIWLFPPYLPEALINADGKQVGKLKLLNKTQIKADYKGNILIYNNIFILQPVSKRDSMLTRLLAKIQLAFEECNFVFIAFLFVLSTVCFQFLYFKYTAEQFEE